MFDAMNRNYAEIRTVLVGMSGGNGLKGEVANLDREFSAFRAEIRQAREDDRAYSEKQWEIDRAERKATQRFIVASVLTTGGLIIAALRFFI